MISEEIRHIDAIVRNFLEFSRPPKLKMQRISPSDVVDGAVQLLRYRLESYGVAVKLLRDGKLPEILADPDQLKEVLVNLLVNACEVMVSGGVITIREEERPDPALGQVVVIRVSDTGPGIPESIRDQVFQPFFSTKEEGTGLGLSIATRIIEDHGGLAGSAANENEGATFIITLPLRERRGMGKILIVDDDPQVRQSFEKLLTQEGHTVKTAASGEAALAIGPGRNSRPGDHGRAPAGDERPGGLPGHPRDRAQAAGHHHDGLRHHRDGHRGHQAGGLRIRPQALRDPGYPGPDRPGPGGRALHALPGGAGRGPRRRPAADAIIGRSKAMQEVYKAIGRVAPTDATVLIRGESGTGKELVARAIYQHSLRIGQTLSGHQLRGHPRDPAGKRTVRL